MRVTVLHNDFMKVAMRFPGGYQPGDVLTQVDEFEPALSEGFPPLPDQVVGEIDDEALLEWVFRIHNAVDGDERNVKLGLRSLSTGDAVALDGRLYSCESLGWQRIEEVKS
jgi:hypothetical protein